MTRPTLLAVAFSAALSFAQQPCESLVKLALPNTSITLAASVFGWIVPGSRG
jgi:hypothetical protein